MRRNLDQERREYERMMSRFPDSHVDYTRRHFSAVASQDPRGCDAGRRVEPVFDDDNEEGD